MSKKQLSRTRQSNFDADFLTQLRSIARSNAQLTQQNWLPHWLDPATSFVGRHPVLTLLVTSGVTALLKSLLW